MTLLEYVKQNAKEISFIEKQVEYSCGRESVDDYILSDVCPEFFDCLNGTGYEKPFKKTKEGYCKYDTGEFKEECKKCWDRKVLVSGVNNNE